MTKPPKPLPGRTRSDRDAGLSADTSERDDQPVTDEERLSALLGQLGSVEGYHVRIERKRTPGMQMQLAGYLGVLPLTTEFYDDVAQQWGGGSYAGRVYRGNDYKANLTFSIAGDPKPREPSASAVETAEGSETNKLLRQLLQKLDAPAQPSPIAQFAEVAKILRELQPPTPQPAAMGAAEMFTMFNTMLDLRGRIAEESERPDDGGIGTILRDGITPLVGLIREKMEQDKTLNTRQLAAGGSSNGNGNTRRVATSSPPAAADDPVAAIFRRIPQVGRSFLAGAARAKKDPALYAELVLDQLGEQEYDMLPHLLALPDFVQRLCAVVPEFEPFPVWFGEFARALNRAVETAHDPIHVELPADAVEIEEVHATARTEEMHAARSGAELHADVTSDVAAGRD